MSWIARILASGTTLLLAIAMTTSNVSARFADDDAEILNAQKDVTKLAKMYADALKNGGKLNAAKVNEITAAMKKKYDELNPSMSIYKPTNKKGLGYDPAKKVPGDGIEKRINDLATKKELSKANLLKEKDLLMRMASYNMAMHDVAKLYTPTKPKAGKGAKEWTKYNSEVKEGTEELIKAVKANDPGGIKKAAGKINGACNDCHTDFR